MKKEYCVSYLTTYYHDFYIEAESEHEAIKIADAKMLEDADNCEFGESDFINIEQINIESFIKDQNKDCIE
jgi:hypothetical protein